ncbi:putative d-isomer specific 2-hydroxyacid dehydrogenase [Diplodia seriata]|uniref:Putative d-isomer specific 2-hydroxyacid dehydrogenase n=1 Tax=Diplodia seriata TaxID=420778 RepID=A0A0G2GB72_9PEZI|nr:putative d-isomer specific 2-hydroxyacid dehydrogenase [Diplodia seriata]
MASTTPQTLPKPIKMAILDDYQRLSTPHFTTFAPTELQIDTYTDTLPPSATDALIARLHPYTIISTMRERTPLPAGVIQALPNLRLLLTTGTRNASLALAACAARAIPVAGTPSDAGPGADKAFSKTTQHAWALVLALADNVARDDAALKNAPSWQPHAPLNVFLAGKTFAVLGLGKLGAAAARVAVLGATAETILTTQGAEAKLG